MLVEIRNHLIDLTLVSCITSLVRDNDYGDSTDIRYFRIYILNTTDPIQFRSKYYTDFFENKQSVEEFEALYIKLVNFWKIAKQQTKIIKLD